jgi:RNA polymerase sigma factor (sigma-70 family)
MQAPFLALLESHRALVYKVARIYGRSSADRDDLAQEIVVHLWRTYPRYDERLKFSTWTYRIALNVAISWQRRERTQTRHVDTADADVFESVAILDASTAADDADLSLLYASIDKLDELNKALVMLYLDDKSHKEMSEVLGITVTNIATKIGRLKDRLRAEFRAAGRL